MKAFSYFCIVSLRTINANKPALSELNHPFEQNRRDTLDTSVKLPTACQNCLIITTGTAGATYHGPRPRLADCPTSGRLRPRNPNSAKSGANPDTSGAPHETVRAASNHRPIGLPAGRIFGKTVASYPPTGKFFAAFPVESRHVLFLHRRVVAIGEHNPPTERPSRGLVLTASVWPLRPPLHPQCRLLAPATIRWQ